MSSFLQWIPLIMMFGAAIGFCYKILKDIQKESFNDGESRMTLKAIEENTQEMKVTLKEQVQTNTEFAKSITECQDRAKSAHHRLDDHDKRITSLENWRNNHEE